MGPHFSRSLKLYENSAANIQNRKLLFVKAYCLPTIPAAAATPSAAEWKIICHNCNFDEKISIYLQESFSQLKNFKSRD